MEARDPDSLLHQQPLFLRLLHRNSASPSPSASPSIAHHTPSLVPFLWESSPGFPKPYPAPDLPPAPPLPPPPILHYSPHASSSSSSLRPPPPPPPPPRLSFSSKMKLMLRRQRSSSLSSIDVSAACAPLEPAADSVVVSVRPKDHAAVPMAARRPSGSAPSRLTVGLEDDLLIAESGKSRCSHLSSQAATVASPEKKHTSSSVGSSVSRGLCSVSPSILMNLHSHATCSVGTLSIHEQSEASEVDAEMFKLNDVECSKKSDSRSNSDSTLVENSSSAPDPQFPRHENVFPAEGFKYETKIEGSQICSKSLDENMAEVASQVELFPLDSTSELKRNSTSTDVEELHRLQDSKGRSWEAMSKHRKAHSLDTEFSSFDTIRERQLRGTYLQGASTELPQVKYKKSPTAKSKASCLPKMCSTSRFAVSPSKSTSKMGI